MKRVAAGVLAAHLIIAVQEPHGEEYYHVRHGCDDHTVQPGDAVTLKPHNGERGCLRRTGYRNGAPERAVGIVKRKWRRKWSAQE